MPLAERPAGYFSTKLNKLGLELNWGLRIHKIVYHTRSTQHYKYTRACDDNCKNMNVTGT